MKQEVKSKTKTKAIVKATRVLVISLFIILAGGGLFAAYVFIISPQKQYLSQSVSPNENLFKFRQKWSTNLPEVNLRNAPLVTDIDNDNKLEVVAALKGLNIDDRGKGIIYILEHDGSIKTNWPIDPEPDRDNIVSTAVVGDINNDEQLEIIAAVLVRPDNGPGRWYGPGIPKIFAYNHQGELVSGFPIVVNQNPYAADALADLTIADFNGDNKTDIVFSYFYGDGMALRQHIHIFNNKGEELPGWPFEFPSFYVRGSAMATGDLDQDGDTELAIGTGEGIYVFNSDGTIAPGWPKETGHFESTPVTIGDVDGDGDLEIVTSSWIMKYNLVIYHHTGEKMLDIELPPYSASTFMRHETALADLDNDGDLELLIPRFNANPGKAWVDAYHHTGEYVDGWPVSYEGIIGNGEEANLAIGDIDGDTDIEIIMGSFTLGDDPDVPAEDRKKAFLYAWHHDGTLVDSFPRIYNGSFGYEGTGLVLTDIERDGKIDLVMSRTADAFKDASETQITVFSMENDYKKEYMEWPMYHKDIAHTGAY